MYIRIYDDISLQINNDETIILDLDTQKYYGVNGLIKVIVDFLYNNEYKLNDLKRIIIEKYQMKHESIEEVFNKSIDLLISKKVIEVLNYD